eukprot:CAMPEP_0197001790 /NCGR_PEP_ID=MMETSP1380-20130617/6418_1 /TAXON_ID=5936 /ORGANISM="Euplotes crassus, Strain CT5" /LENGTH=319 /DNA_ID=CAMNT_0042419609 /DNA_START=116 /DNA_END=1076 /DNA_ORIENTATION=+
MTAANKKTNRCIVRSPKQQNLRYAKQGRDPGFELKLKIQKLKTQRNNLKKDNNNLKKEMEDFKRENQQHVTQLYKQENEVTQEYEQKLLSFFNQSEALVTDPITKKVMNDPVLLPTGGSISSRTFDGLKSRTIYSPEHKYKNLDQKLPNIHLRSIMNHIDTTKQHFANASACKKDSADLQRQDLTPNNIDFHGFWKTQNSALEEKIKNTINRNKELKIQLEQYRNRCLSLEENYEELTKKLSIKQKLLNKSIQNFARLEKSPPRKVPLRPIARISKIIKGHDPHPTLRDASKGSTRSIQTLLKKRKKHSNKFVVNLEEI